MTNPPNKDKLSTLLKETRQHKGITLEMVHEATKIPLDALKAIEQGYSVHKLQTFYYRGFIKIYTKYLELDETQVLQEYGMLDSAAPKPQKTASKEFKNDVPIPTKNVVKEVVRPILSGEVANKRTTLIIKVIAFLIIGFLIFKWGGSFVKNNANKKQDPASKVVKKPVIKPAVKHTTRNKTKDTKDIVQKESSKEASREPVQKESVGTVSEPSSDAKQAEVKPVDAAEEKGDKRSKQIELTVRATKNGFLQVKADGQVVFQSALKKGDSETWKAEKEIELSGRNINLLEFELNGKMLGALGASDRGAKKVVFTKDGLSVKK